MTFLSSLFGGGPKTPMPVAPPPKIGDAAGEAAARETRARQLRKFGVEDTMMAAKSPLGVPGSPVTGVAGIKPAGQPVARSMLG